MIAACPIVAAAGQIYGTVSSGGHALASAQVVLQCGDARNAVQTGPSGGYRVFLKADGPCTVTINGTQADKAVFLYASPTRYNFYGSNGKFERQ